MALGITLAWCWCIVLLGYRPTVTLSNSRSKILTLGAENGDYAQNLATSCKEQYLPVCRVSLKLLITCLFTYWCFFHLTQYGNSNLNAWAAETVHVIVNVVSTTATVQRRRMAGRVTRSRKDARRSTIAALTAKTCQLSGRCRGTSAVTALDATQN